MLLDYGALIADDHVNAGQNFRSSQNAGAQTGGQASRALRLHRYLEAEDIELRRALAEPENDATKNPVLPDGSLRRN